MVLGRGLGSGVWVGAGIDHLLHAPPPLTLALTLALALALALTFTLTLALALTLTLTLALTPNLTLTLALTCCMRRRPSKLKGFVTMPTVSVPA